LCVHAAVREVARPRRPRRARPLEDYGRVFPATSARPVPSPNPQPTFYAPLGTPVVAVVTGTVTSIPTLYSNDFSIMVASPGQGGTWEHEHVINVRVNVGDRVTAGQHIADVSNFECVWGRNNSAGDPLCQSGLGLVELGLLYAGNPPNHRCPFEPELVDPARRHFQSARFSQISHQGRVRKRQPLWRVHVGHAPVCESGAGSRVGQPPPRASVSTFNM
jgi:biotin carboxyl carrier protein